MFKVQMLMIDQLSLGFSLYKLKLHG